MTAHPRTVGVLTPAHLGSYVVVTAGTTELAGILHGVDQHRSPSWHTHLVIDHTRVVASPNATVTVTEVSPDMVAATVARGRRVLVLAAVSTLALALWVAFTAPPLSGGTILALLLVTLAGAALVRALQVYRTQRGWS